MPRIKLDKRHNAADTSEAAGEDARWTVWADQSEALAVRLLRGFNQKKIRLADIPSHKRIFLFIFTRAMKTYQAIRVLLKEGYGQDAATLLRNLLDNLITVRYIIHDPAQADTLARRFVDYKWVIFRRSLAEQEAALPKGSRSAREDFESRRARILAQVGEFKVKYGVRSDRALLTWSGKTVKDMARAVSPDLLEEYENVFRLSSRFSHPTILGDKEYMIQNGKVLTFSPRPSSIGVEINGLHATFYLVQFLLTIDELFGLNQNKALEVILRPLADGRRKALEETSVPTSPKDVRPPMKDIKESTVVFDAP